MRKNETSSKVLQQIQEVEDWLTANPGVTKSRKVRDFCIKFQKSERSVWGYFQKADVNIKERIAKQEAIKSEVYAEEAKRVASENILSREKGLEILTRTALMKAIRIEGHNTIMLPSFSESTRAVLALANLLGWRKEYVAKNKTPLQINVLSEDMIEELRKLSR
jgi:hypothetical protein